MSEERRDTALAAQLISSLGGPILNSDDMKWLNDLEAGKLLLGWLADQVSTSADLAIDDGQGGTCENAEEDGQDRHISARLRNVALEVDEVLMFVSNFSRQ